MRCASAALSVAARLHGTTGESLKGPALAPPVLGAVAVAHVDPRSRTAGNNASFESKPERDLALRAARLAGKRVDRRGVETVARAARW